MLENPTNPDSLALIGFTTAVVTANDASGQMEATYEIQVSIFLAFILFFHLFFVISMANRNNF